MTTNQQIEFDKINYDSITALAPQEKSVPNTTTKYNEIPLKYNFGTPEKPLLEEFLVEGPELTSPVGISNNPMNGKDAWAILTVLPISTDTVAKAFHDSIVKTYFVSGIHLSKVKGRVGIAEFDPKQPSATGFKNPIYYPRNKDTGDLIQGREPSMYLKLFRWGKGSFETKTLFTDPDLKPLPWEILQNVEMKFIPLIHIEKIYIGGGKASLQIKTKSAIVTSVQARNTNSTQTVTAQKIKETRPNEELTLKEQIARLMSDRQDALLAAKIIPGSVEQKGQQKKEENQKPGAPTIVDPTGIDIKSFLSATSIQ